MSLIAHVRFGYEAYNSIIDFTLSYDLIFVNILFYKRISHLIIFGSRLNINKIDFFLIMKVNTCSYFNCKAVPHETILIHHRLLVLDVWKEIQKD